MALLLMPLTFPAAGGQYLGCTRSCDGTQKRFQWTWNRGPMTKKAGFPSCRGQGSSPYGGGCCRLLTDHSSMPVQHRDGRAVHPDLRGTKSGTHPDVPAVGSRVAMLSPGVQVRKLYNLCHTCRALVVVGRWRPLCFVPADGGPEYRSTASERVSNQGLVGLISMSGSQPPRIPGLGALWCWQSKAKIQVPNAKTRPACEEETEAKLLSRKGVLLPFAWYW